MPKAQKLPSGKYRIRYTDQYGRRQSVTRRSAADVNAAYKRILGDMSRGEYVDPRAGRITLNRWSEDWLVGARNLGQGGQEMYRQALIYILPELGRKSLAQISPADIDRYLATKAKTLAASTVHRHYRALNRCFTVAVQRGVIARNPCEHVHPPRVGKTKLTVLGPDQVDALADAITSRYRAWVYVAAYGGLRWSESVGLRRSRIDGQRVTVVEQLVRRRDGTWDRCEPKAGSRRTVNLPSFVATELKEHVDSFTLLGPDGLVFPTSNGTPIQGPSWTTNTFKRALRKADLPDIRVHDLRHTAAALAIAAGAHPKAIQERMGHSSIRTTLDVYGHLLPSMDEDVAARLEQLRTGRRLRAV